MDNTLANPYSAAIAMERAKISEYEARIRECQARIQALEGLNVREPDAVDLAVERQLREAAWHESPPHFAPHSSLPQYSPREFPDGEPGGDMPLPAAAPLAPPPSLAAMTPRSDSIRSARDQSGLPPLPPLPVLISPSIQTGSSDLASFPLVSNADAPQAEHKSAFVLPKREVSAQALDLLRYLITPASSEKVYEYAQSRGMGMSRASLSTFLYSYRTKYGFLEALPDNTYLLSSRGSAYVSAPARSDVKFEAPSAVTAAPGAGLTQVEDLTRTEGADRTGGY